MNSLPKIPLLEWDEDNSSIIDPVKIHRSNKPLPDKCILCFYSDAVKKLTNTLKAIPAYTVHGCGDPTILYEIHHKGKKCLIVFPGIGAPLSGAVLEICIALGVKKTVAFGSAGVLYKEIPRNRIILIDSAIRDEGLSFHYLPPTYEVNANPEMLTLLSTGLKQKGHDYIIGKSWTTDAIYRETKNKIIKRKEQGCIAVEMEASALMAIAEFRKILFGQIVLASDDISQDNWDKREQGKNTAIKDKVLMSLLEIL